MNDAEKERLEMAVSAALGEAQKPYKYPDPSGQAWGRLVSEVEGAIEFQSLTGTMQFVGGIGAQFSHRDLARWMVRRASEMDAAIAVGDALSYFSGEDFQAYRIMLLHGIRTDAEYEISDGIVITRPSAIPDPGLRETCIRLAFDALPLPEIDAVLCVAFRQKRCHATQAEEGHREAACVHDKSLENARLCLSLVGSFGPQNLGVTTIAAPEVPTCGWYGWQYGQYRGNVFTRDLMLPTVPRVSELGGRLSRMKTAERDRLKVPMYRLNEYESTHDPTERAIALRVALEALFLRESQGELRYRVALHAAFFLGTDESQRREVFKTVKAAYDLGSTAVHSGHLKEKTAKQDGAVLEAASEIVREGIVRLIQSGEPKFEDLVLKAGYSDATE